MGELRSVRIAVSLTPREHDALREIANRQRVPVAKAAGRIIRGHLVTGHDDSPAPPEEVVPETLSSGRELCAPPWLPPIDKTAYPERGRMRAGGLQALLDRYPGELADLPDGWAADAAVREQLWALSVWRDHLDVGVHDDPRMELAFARGLERLHYVPARTASHHAPPRLTVCHTVTIARRRLVSQSHSASSLFGRKRRSAWPTEVVP